jgi:hypothetical protein
MYSLMYGVTQWLQDGKGLTAAVADLIMLPMTGMSAIVTTPVARRNVVRLPHCPPVTPGPADHIAR